MCNYCKHEKILFSCQSPDASPIREIYVEEGLLHIVTNFGTETELWGEAIEINFCPKCGDKIKIEKE